MLPRQSHGFGRDASRRTFRMGDARVWLGIAGILVAAYLLSQVAGGLLSSGPGPSQPAASGTPTADSSYLARGYDELQRSGTDSTEGSFWSLWAGMLIPLGIVILAAYAILRGLRYFNTRVAMAGSTGRMLESLDTLSLGQHGAIHLVRVGSRVVVVGAGAHQLSLLGELDAEQAESLLAAHRTRQGTGPGPERRVLQSFRDLVGARMEAPTPPAAPGEPAVEGVEEPGAVREQRLAAILAEIQAAPERSRPAAEPPKE